MSLTLLGILGCFVLLILLGLVIVAAGVLYAASLIKTKNKQKRRSEVSPAIDDEPINMITPEKAQTQQKAEPDTLFDLDSLYFSPDKLQHRVHNPYNLPERLAV